MYIGSFKKNELKNFNVYPKIINNYLKFKNLKINKFKEFLNEPDYGCYEGMWKNDAIDGLGRVEFPSGAVYIGGFKNNK